MLKHIFLFLLLTYETPCIAIKYNVFVFVFIIYFSSKLNKTYTVKHFAAEKIPKRTIYNIIKRA